MFSTFFVICIGLLAITRPSESQRRGGPRVVTESQSFEAEAGASITLPCNIKNVGRRSVFWFKGDGPDGRELIMQMKSLRGQFTVPRQYREVIDSGKMAIDGSNLMLKHLTAEDEDSYTCSIAWARQSVTHTLTVIGGEPVTPPPSLFVTAVPSDGQVTVGEGQPTALSCVASGDLPTTVSWFREGEPNVLTVGNVLNIFESNRDDTGRYVCTAENGVSVPVSFDFDLTVEYVEVHADVEQVVASGDNSMAQLSCQISGFPQPQVAWYTSVGPVSEDDRHRMLSQDNTQYLILEQMTSADLGEYQCYGYNEKARDHATITVSSAPGPVTVVAIERSGRGRYALTWQVNSLAPIRFYHVAVREANSDEVKSISAEGSNVPNDGHTLYYGTTELDLTPGQTYEIMVKAVAEEYQPGPDQEEPFIFNVPYSRDSGYSPVESGPRMTYGTDTPGETQTEGINDEDAWKWWKVTMTLLSRLPQVARIMQ